MQFAYWSLVRTTQIGLKGSCSLPRDPGCACAQGPAQTPADVHVSLECLLHLSTEYACVFSTCIPHILCSALLYHLMTGYVNMKHSPIHVKTDHAPHPMMHWVQPPVTTSP